MPFHPRTCSLLYSLSCLFDALDGAAARRFEQSTRFGAVLDMVIDRCTTSCLLVFLASAFPRWSIVFQSLISLDLASNYMHMYAALAVGGESHKKMNNSSPWVMRLYYTNTVGNTAKGPGIELNYLQKVLFTVCAMNELFFIALYLLSFSASVDFSINQYSGGMSSQPKVSSDPSVIGWSAAAMELSRANKIDSLVPQVLLYTSCLFMIFKQYVNVVQLMEACKMLAESDIETRKRPGLPRRPKTKA